MSEKTFPDGELLDIGGAADYLSVSSKSIRRYISSGKIRAKKIRNVWFCPREELDKLIEAKNPPPPAPPAAVALPAFDASALDAIGATLEQIKDRMKAIDDRLFLFSQERESRHIRPDSSEKDQDFEFLKADNLKLIEEQQRLKKELADLKQNGSKDTQLLKSKSEEAETLKAKIASNERGLNLLRAELAEREEAVARKDENIRELKERINALEQEAASLRSSRKSGLLGGLRITGTAPDKKAGSNE